MANIEQERNDWVETINDSLGELEKKFREWIRTVNKDLEGMRETNRSCNEVISSFWSGVKSCEKDDPFPGIVGEMLKVLEKIIKDQGNLYQTACETSLNDLREITEKTLVTISHMLQDMAFTRKTMAGGVLSILGHVNGYEDEYAEFEQDYSDLLEFSMKNVDVELFHRLRQLSRYLDPIFNTNPEGTKNKQAFEMLHILLRDEVRKALLSGNAEDLHEECKQGDGADETLNISMTSGKNKQGGRGGAAKSSKKKANTQQEKMEKEIKSLTIEKLMHEENRVFLDQALLLSHLPQTCLVRDEPTHVRDSQRAKGSQQNLAGHSFSEAYLAEVASKNEITVSRASKGAKGRTVPVKDMNLGEEVKAIAIEKPGYYRCVEPGCQGGKVRSLALLKIHVQTAHKNQLAVACAKKEKYFNKPEICIYCSKVFPLSATDENQAQECKKSHIYVNSSETFFCAVCAMSEP